MKKGYLILKFSEDFNKDFGCYIEKLPENIFYYEEKNGIKIGGKEKDDPHLTLFFGFNDNEVSPDQIITETTNLIKRPFKISGLDTFLTKSKCKILYLKIEDEDELLNNTHNKLLKFSHFEDEKTTNFIPHITLGYIKENINLKEIPKPNFDEVSFNVAEYKVKDF